MTGHQCNIIVLNAHASTQYKINDSKESVFEELEQVSDHIPENQKKILLGDFNVKFGQENVFKTTIGE